MKKNCIIFSLLFLIIFGASASAAKIRNDIPSEEFLNDLGIIKKDMVENETEMISRGEFAYWASQLIPYQVHYEKADQQFSDVIYGTKYFDGIMKLYNSGIIHGVSNMNFAPDDKMTYENACVIMVRLLGYDIEVNDGMYTTKAGNIRLTNGISASDGYITKADALKLIYNSLFIDIKYDNTIDGYVSETETVLEKRFNIYEICGIVNDNGRSALAGISDIGNGNIKIGDSTYSYDGEAESLLGKNVYAYYNDDDNNIVYIYASENKNAIEYFSADEIESFKDNAYEVYEKSGNRKKQKKLATDYKVIYNTEAVTTTLSKEEHLNVMKPECGNVTLIDNNNDGRFDVVIIESYETVVLSAYDNDNNILYNKLENHQPIIINNIKEAVIEGSDGKYLDENNLVQNRVLSVMKSLSNNYCRIIISSEIVSGKLTSVSGNRKSITVNDTEYDIAEDIKNDVEIPGIGKNVEVYIRHDGKVAYITSELADSEILVYIKNLYRNDYDEYFIRVYTEDNNTRELHLPDKITVDGVKYKSAATAVDYINNSVYGIDHLAVVKLKKGDKFDDISSIDLPDYKTSQQENDEFHIVNGIYKKKGLINKVSVDGTIGTSADTKVFFIPEDGELSDAKVTTFSSAAINTSANYIYSVYSLHGEDMIADAVLIRTGGGYNIKNTVIANARPNYVIMDIEQTINSDGEICWKLYLTNGKALSTVYTKTLNGIKCMKSGLEASIGDIIKYGTDRDGMIPDDQLVIMYSPSHNKEQLYYNTGSFNGGNNSIANWSSGLIMATPIKKNETYIRIDNTPVGMIPISGMYYIVYDKEQKNRVFEGKVTDINTYDTVGEDASVTIFDFKEDYANYVYIVR